MNPFNIAVSSQQYGELAYNDVIPEKLKEYILPDSHSIVGHCPSGHILMQQINDINFSIYSHTILLTKSDTFLIYSQQPSLCLNFCLQNSFLLYNRGIVENLSFHEGQFNMSYHSKIFFLAEFKEDRLYRFLTIHYHWECLSRLANSYPIMASFLANTSQKKEAFLYESNMFASKEMKKIITRLLFERCRNEEIDIYIKRGRVMELLIKVLEQQPQPAALSSTRLTLKDTEKIYEAKSWLDKHGHRIVTLFELSKKVGMNVHKLSTGFLQITGTTVFHYHRNIRMALAMQLLAETDRDLFDIGTEIGYIDGKTFSKEFKKAKGIPPLEYRKRRRSQQDLKSALSKVK